MAQAQRPIPELRVASFEAYHSLIQSRFHYGVMYRGMKDTRWPLVPSIGQYWPMAEQKGLTKAQFRVVESDLIRVFRKESARHLGYMAKDGWEVWSIAQHHGLPTRLMDWTYNPLVALFFAVERPFEGDSVVYALSMTEGEISIYEEENGANPLIDVPDAVREVIHPYTVALHPLDVEELRTYQPSHLTHRVDAQSAIFTVQPDPTEPLWHPDLQRICIEQSSRERIKEVLFDYGITRKLLFPGLDGVADWLKQMRFGT